MAVEDDEVIRRGVYQGDASLLKVTNTPDGTTSQPVVPPTGIRGVWPAIDAVRVDAGKFQGGVGVGIGYTVAVGKILFISGAYLTSRNSGAAGKRVVWAIRNASDVYYKALMVHYYDQAGQASDAQRYVPAIEVPALYDVYIDVDDAQIDANGTFNGWLEDD